MNASRGASLIEVLVALAIVSVTVLGLAQLQYRAVLLAQRGERSLQAQLAAQNLAERMRMNAAAASRYVLAPGGMPASTSDCGTTACSAEQLADWQLATAADELRGARALLPGGALSVQCADCGAAGARLISVYWDHADAASAIWDCGAGGSRRDCARLVWQP